MFTRYVALPRNAVLTALPSIQMAELPRSHCKAEPSNEKKFYIFTRYVALPRNAVLTALPSIQMAEPPRSYYKAEPSNEKTKVLYLYSLRGSAT